VTLLLYVNRKECNMKKCDVCAQCGKRAYCVHRMSDGTFQVQQWLDDAESEDV
jgi:hypothetical protein